MALSIQVQRKLNEYFKSQLGLKDYRNSWLKGNCPDCGKLKLGISISKNRVNCFYCGSKPDPLLYVMSLEKLETKPEVYKFLNVFEGLDFLESPAKQIEKHKVQLPESFRLLCFGESLVSKMARNYMRSRGFNINKLSSRGIGYCTKGKYSGFIIFPFYQQGKLIYFIGRRFIQMGEKFKNPEIEEFGIMKSMILYNIDSLAIYDKNYLVESIPNSLTLGDNSIASLGKSVSSYQKSLILRSPTKEIILGLDPDAITDSIKLAFELINFKRIKLLNLPEGKDINDIGKKETLKIEKNSPWLTYNDLIKLKNKYEKPQYSY